MTIPSWVRRIISLGIREGDPETPAKQLLTFNTLNFVFIVVSSLYIPLFVYLGVPDLAIGAACANIFLLGVAVITSRGAHRFSRTLFIVGCNTLIALLASTAGPDAGVQHCLFAFVMIPFTIFGSTEKRYLYWCAILPVFTWFTLESLDYSLLPRTSDAPSLNRFIDPTTFVIIAIHVFSVHRTLDKRQSEIEAQNHVLLEREAELRQLSCYQEKVVESMNDGLILTDRNGVISKVNQAACHLLDFSEEELLDSPLSSFFASEEGSSEAKKSSFSNLLGRKERTIVTKSGAKVPVLTSGALVRGEGHRPDAQVCIVHDFRERKRAQEYVEKVLQAAPGGLIVADERWRIERVNEAVVELFGYADEELLGRPIGLLLPAAHHEAEQAFFEGCASDSGDERAGSTREVRALRKSGSNFPVHLSFRSTTLGEHPKLLITVVDRSEYVRIEDERRKMEQDIAYASGMAEVSAGVLHNVGNVVNSVNTAAYSAKRVLHDGSLPLLRRFVGLLEDHNQDRESLLQFFATDPRGVRIVEFLSALLEKFQTENTKVDRELDSLQESVEHIIAIVSSQQRFASTIGLVRELDVADFLESAIALSGIGESSLQLLIERSYEEGLSLLVDQHKLTQIIVNLLRNARDALSEVPPDQRVVRVVARRDAEGWIVIEVSDNGVGIAHENLNRVFVHGFTTKPTGHGFGLHTSATAARELGGSLNVDSEGPGQGARFLLKLPSQDRKAA